jgi:diguanylate cyclase (GGDEF)-like protein/PAS domain S-box-containing protein
MSSENVATGPDAWSILDAVGEAVSVHGPDGMLVYANPRSRHVMADLAESMDHRPLGEIAWRARLPEGTEVPAARLPVEITRRTGVPVRDRVVGFPGALGGVVWLRITTRRLGGPGALPCSVVATFTDVTADRHAVRELEQTIDDQRLIVEGLIEGVVFQDHDGAIVASNRGAEEVLGLTADQLHGRESVDPRWAAIHEDGTPWPGDTHPAMIALRTGTPQLQRIMGVHRPDGQLRWIQVNARPQLDGDGCVSGVVTSFLDVTAQRGDERRRVEAETRLREHLSHLADHDPLTGLLNRRGFARALDVQLAHARRYGTGGAVLVLDLDGFKEVNDTFGHETGDGLLVEVADLLRSGTRTSDVVARLGGDEFAVLLPTGDAEAARGAAAAIEALLDGRGPVDGSDGLRVSASVGAATIAPEDQAAGLLARADRAMYRAKAARAARI